MNDIIKQLKENLARFADMKPELLAKAAAIHPKHFMILMNDGEWGMPKTDVFLSSERYQLRPDYEEPEQGVVKCEVSKFQGKYYYPKNTADKLLHTACGYSDFIGIELEGQIFGRLYKNKAHGTYALIIDAEQLDDYEVCDMTKAKVLFRKTNP